MSQKSIGIIMNGVSGPHGLPPAPACARSSRSASRAASLLRRRHAACRSSRSSSAAARPSSPSSPPSTASSTTRPTSTPRSPTRAGRSTPTSSSRRPASPAIRKAIAAGKAIYTEKPTAESVEEALELARLAAGRRHQERRRARQALPARPAEAQAPHRLRLLRPHPLACAASSATGCSRATGSPRSARAGTTAPKTAAASSSTCSRTGTTCSRTCSAGSSRVYAQAATHIPDARRRERASPTPPPPTTPPTAIFELEGGVDRAAQLQLDRAREPRRARRVPGRRHARLAPSSACSAAKIQPRNATPKPVWNPDLADDHDYDADWIERADNDVFENGFKTQWEEFLRHVLEDAPVRVRPARRRPRRAAGRGGPASSHAARAAGSSCRALDAGADAR